MPNWTDASSWIDILDHFLIGVIAIGLALIPAFATRSKLKNIEGQVVNGHKDKPPLRADLDEAIEVIKRLEAKVDKVESKVDDLTSDISDERSERRKAISNEREDWRSNVDHLREYVEERIAWILDKR